MLVLEPFRYLFMFPLSYKHPKGQADLHCVFMKPHSHSSTCDRKVAGGEEPSAAELDLKQVPEGWRWVVVRWWRRCALWRSLSSCVCCVCVVLCLVSLFGISFPVFAGEIDTSYPSRPCSSATRSLKLFLFPFLVELTVPSFLLPRTSLLFYYSTDSVFLGVFLPPYLTMISLSRWFVSDTFQVFLSRSCTFSSYFLKWTEWLVS